jgi:hypothetical protein
MLTVRADGSRLNQILREISQLTGMKITGGVGEEPVFGNYGPAKPAPILTLLLDGTGSNIVLRGGPQGTVTELILTPRNGGVTPPSPSTFAGAGDALERHSVSQDEIMAAARLRAESRRNVRLPLTGGATVRIESTPSP